MRANPAPVPSIPVEERMRRSGRILCARDFGERAKSLSAVGAGKKPSVTRILAVADNEALWPDNVAALASLAQVVLCLGDLHKADVAPLCAQGTPVLGVYGNHCSPGYLRDSGATDITGDGPLGVAETPFGTVLGVSGCVRYKPHGRFLWTQEEYAEALADAPPARWVITHCPPTGINDEADPAHVGIDALRDYVDTHRPERLFHGHTYPTDPCTQHGSTAIHYVHGYALIDAVS